ncbi:pseudouridine synthase [Calidifontibacter terrae]
MNSPKRRSTGNKSNSGMRRSGPPVPPKRGPEEPVDVHNPDGVRLQKLLAAAGVGSRRVCENLITDGRVSVDGHVVTELGVRIDPDTQTVHVDGDRVVLDESRVYLAFNKPLGVVSTMNDDLGRENVGDYVVMRKERLFHVGRLDSDTEGLLLLTNDGDLANRLQHPRYGVPKTYVAVVPGPLPRDIGKQLREGVELEDGFAKVDSFKVIDSRPGWVMVELILHEGRNRIVRRLMEEVGHPVESLVRTDVGPVRLGDLRPGKMRPLTKAEVAGLYKSAEL